MKKLYVKENYIILKWGIFFLSDIITYQFIVLFLLHLCWFSYFIF